MDAPPLERDLLFLIHDVARMMRTRIDQWARRHEMTRAQWAILMRLERHPGISQAELAALVEVEPISVARLIDRLEAKDLVERRPDPDDRRLRRLHLRPASKPILKEIKRCKAQLNDLMMADIPLHAREAVAEVLLQIKANLTATAEAARPQS